MRQSPHSWAILPKLLHKCDRAHSWACTASRSYQRRSNVKHDALQLESCNALNASSDALHWCMRVVAKPCIHTDKWCMCSRVSAHAHSRLSHDSASASASCALKHQFMLPRIDSPISCHLDCITVYPIICSTMIRQSCLLTKETNTQPCTVSGILSTV